MIHESDIILLTVLKWSIGRCHYFVSCAGCHPSRFRATINFTPQHPVYCCNTNTDSSSTAVVPVRVVSGGVCRELKERGGERFVPGTMYTVLPQKQPQIRSASFPKTCCARNLPTFESHSLRPRLSGTTARITTRSSPRHLRDWCLAV